MVELAVNCGDNELLAGAEKNATLVVVRAPLGDQFAELLKSVLVGVQVLRAAFCATAGDEIDPRQKRMLTRRKQELIFLLILL
jgi:hypothetical protein